MAAGTQFLQWQSAAGRRCVLARTNGIILLGERGFDPAIQAKAEKVFNWLSGYLAHPVNNVTVLHD
jgi:hypothetical protein